jgi:hypothetical protein
MFPKIRQGAAMIAQARGLQPAGRETAITTSAVPSTAACLDARLDAKSADVLRVAEAWESWVNGQE